MPNVVGPDCVDSPSTDGNCLYPAKALGGDVAVSPNVYFEGEKVNYYASTNFPEAVDGIKINPLIPAPCQPGQRRINPVVNNSVFINGNLFAVTGDEASLVGVTTPRTLTGPFKYPTIDIVNPTPT